MEILQECLREIREMIGVFFVRDPAARSTWDVVSCYPGFHAILLHRLTHWLWRKNFFWLARFLAHLGRLLTGIEIHPGAIIGKRFFIDHGMGIVIGETAEIGDDCSLYHGVTLGGTSWNQGKRHPTLGKGVVVGTGAKILGPIQIGDDVKIGSNAVVLKDVPAGGTVVGVPGRVVMKTEITSDQGAKDDDFHAYAAVKEVEDPMQQALARLHEQVKLLQQEIEDMRKKQEKTPKS